VIKSLHTENFRVLSGVHDYEFPEGIIGIVGPNGQGKSTLINSIAWAMYGQEALPLKAREPVTWGEKQALVRVAFRLNDGQEWVVERSQKTSGPGKAKLYQPGKDPHAEGSAPVTAAVTELMGVDREGFLISVFARQFELDRLRSMDPTPRMQTVLRLLGINQITKAVKIVREDANEQKKSLDVLRASQIDADALKSQIDGLVSNHEVLTTAVVTARDALGLAQANKAIIELERTKLDAQRQAYRKYLNDLQAKQTTLALTKAGYDRAFNDIATNAPIKPFEPQYKPVEVIDETEIAGLKNAYLALRDDYVQFKAERDAYQNQMDNMHEVCPTCKRPYDGVIHMEREKRAVKEKIDHLNTQMESVAAVGEEARESWVFAEKAKIEADYLIGLNTRLEEGYKAQVLAYEQAMAHRAEAQQTYELNKAARDQAQKELDELEPVEDVREEDGELLQALDETNAEIARLSSEVATDEANAKHIAGEIGRLNAQLEQAKKATKESKKLEREVVEKQTTAEELQRLKETMIGGIIPALNERASALIDQMTEGKYTELSLTPEYEIEYRNHLGELKNFLNLSGGEQTVFALALRLSISDLRAGNLGVLFLDEAISNLSSEDGRQESVWSAIESLTSRFHQVFVITHVEQYKDRAPYSVRL
jgi:exonuclease SbcC